MQLSSHLRQFYIYAWDCMKNNILTTVDYLIYYSVNVLCQFKEQIIPQIRLFTFEEKWICLGKRYNFVLEWIIFYLSIRKFFFFAPLTFLTWKIVVLWKNINNLKTCEKYHSTAVFNIKYCGGNKITFCEVFFVYWNLSN